jgi:hypothetical protein
MIRLKSKYHLSAIVIRDTLNERPQNAGRCRSSRGTAEARERL